MTDFEFAAKYPFSEEARTYLEKQGTSFHDLHEELDYAAQRVKNVK